MASVGKEPVGAASRVDKSTIERAVSALLKYKSKLSAGQNPQLFPDDDYVYLNVTLKKIPSKSRTKPFRISLPHPLLDLSSQICLIIDDRAQSTTPSSEDIKKLVKAQGIPISKVLKISKLKTNYKPFEAKRKLCDSYDLFLVDKRVVHLLPKLLGKEFFKKKKLPLGVDLSKKKNLKLQVERALGSALLYIRTGTCSVVKVGKVSMEKDEVVDNVFDAIVGAVEKVPKKWNGVRSLHLKFYDSVALPIYQALPDVKLKIEGVKSEKGAELVKLHDNEAESKEMSGMKDANSRKKKKKNGRIHELQYMDVGDVMESDNDQDDMDGNEAVESEANVEFVGQKKRKGILNGSDVDGNEETNAVEDDDALTILENIGNKRNRIATLKSGVLDVLNGKKQAKKKAKAEKVEGTKSKEDRLPGLEKPGRKKGKKDMEHLGKTSGRIAKVKDVKPKKGASAE